MENTNTVAKTPSDALKEARTTVIGIEKTEAPTSKPKAVSDKPLTEAVKKPSQKTRAPKARKVEELIEASTKNMTDKEREVLIAYLKEQLTEANNKIEHYKNNTEAAFKQTREMEQNFTAMEAYFKERLEYVSESAKSFYKALCLATKGDVK